MNPRYRTTQANGGNPVQSGTGILKPSLVYLGLGANLGDRQVNLRAALAGIAALPRSRLLRSAGIYQTRPVGCPPGQEDYFNSGCLVETGLSPREMLAETQRLEKELGRTPLSGREPWGPRMIDIDILLWGGLVLSEPDLIIPHPRLTERAFALMPLADLDPGAIHPGCGKAVTELLERIGPNNEVVRRLPL